MMAHMNKTLQPLSGALSVLAVIALAGLAAADCSNHLRYSELHQRTGAVALILIGASYIAVQFGAGCPMRRLLKETFLGAAFMLWGFEQLLPASRFVTAVDSVVMGIFVLDLGIIIWGSLRRDDGMIS
jgi:hypothetical protein